MEQQIKIAISQEELNNIYRLRYSVYVEEMGYNYSNADHEKKILSDEKDKSAVNLFLHDLNGNEIIGINRYHLVDFYNSDPELELRYKISLVKNLGLTIMLSSRLMIRKDHRNSENFHRLLVALFKYGLNHNYLLNIIDCSPNLVAFYERVGYRKYYKNFTDSVLGEKTPMILLGHDLKHLRKVGSPLYKYRCEYKIQNRDYSDWFELIDSQAKI